MKARATGDVTLEEAAALLGVHRTTAYRQLRAHLIWVLHRGRRVRAVKLANVRAVALAHLREDEDVSVIKRLDVLERKLSVTDSGRFASARRG